jgi:hypothetical protein
MRLASPQTKHPSTPKTPPYSQESQTPHQTPVAKKPQPHPRSHPAKPYKAPASDDQ